MPRLVIASDHAGFALKEEIKEAFQDIEWIDLGTDSESSCDYAEYGHALAQSIENKEVSFGVLVCGSGIGISIAANRNKAIRAALCTNATMARLARAHNDANVLALGSRIIGREVAFDCIRAFLETEFEGGRHQARIDKINKGIK